jgi:uncharacterized protein (DUF2147 family)
VQIPGVYDNTGKRSKPAKGEDAATTRKPKSLEAKTDTQTPAAPAPSEQVAPPAGPAVTTPAAPAVTTQPSTTSMAIAPYDTAAAPPAPPPPNAPPQVNQQSAAPPPAPASTIATVPPASSSPPPSAIAAVPSASSSPPPSAAVQASSPLGVWLTEEKEGKVRIEQCGANLCGFAVDKKSNQNGEQVLINMKPGKDKWSGRILDPATGSTYDSTIALKGPETLRVQGCAFGGMFCGGQTWTRVN